MSIAVISGLPMLIDSAHPLIKGSTDGETTAMDERFGHQFPPLLPPVATRHEHRRESRFFDLHAAVTGTLSS